MSNYTHFTQRTQNENFIKQNASSYRETSGDVS
jgi:hypothetical protein